MAAFVWTSYVLFLYRKFYTVGNFREFNLHGQLDLQNILAVNFSQFMVVCLASICC